MHPLFDQAKQGTPRVHKKTGDAVRSVKYDGPAVSAGRRASPAELIEPGGGTIRLWSGDYLCYREADDCYFGVTGKEFEAEYQ